MIIDQHAADERVRLEQFTQGKRHGQYSVERSWNSCGMARPETSILCVLFMMVSQENVDYYPDDVSV